MNEIANMNDITEKIKDRVKVSFFEMLPDEKFAELVDMEIKQFFEATCESFSISRVDTSYYSSSKYELNTPVSPFRMMVWEECKKLVKEKMQNILTEEGLSVAMGWDTYGVEKGQLSDRLEKILKEQTVELASSFFSTMFAQAFSDVEYNLKESIVSDINNNFNNGY